MRWPRRLQQLRQPYATTPDPAEPAQEPRLKSDPPEDDRLIAQRRMLQDPRYRAAWRQQARLNYGLRRENIIRVVGLTPEQADAVIELQIDRELARTEDPRALNEDFQANERAHQAKLTELLGQEKSARLQEYMESRREPHAGRPVPQSARGPGHATRGPGGARSSPRCIRKTTS